MTQLEHVAEAHERRRSEATSAFGNGSLFAEELLDRWWRDRATASTAETAVSAESEAGA